MEPFNFAVIGHVDTGKSTLCGHLLVRAGAVPEWDGIVRRAARDRAVYAQYARVMDIYEEEMVKGKTHEWSQWDFAWHGRPFRLVDTPGHRAYIREMIDGLQTCTAAVLILSAREGEFESSFVKGGQTREDIAWSTARQEAIEAAIRPYVAGLAFRTIKFIPASGYEGTGLDELMAYLTGLADGAKAVDAETTEPVVQAVAVKGSFRLLADSVLLTSGWTGVAHVAGCEVPVEVSMTGILTKQGSRADLTLQFACPVSLSRGARVVLRSGAAGTVAQGRVAMIKPASRAEAAKLA
jgi:translation elongation factor EF-Tu-like GTPase